MTLPDDWFDQIKAAYPKRSRGKNYGWPKAYKLLQGHLRQHSFETILQGTKDYCEAAKLSGDYGTEFIKQACTFFGPGLHFLDEYEIGEDRIYRKPEEYTEEQRQADAAKAWAELNRLKGVK